MKSLKCNSCKWYVALVAIIRDGEYFKSCCKGEVPETCGDNYKEVSDDKATVPNDEGRVQWDISLLEGCIS